ncbi:hypothetical protein BpHYR1_048081 [Brachionus plicatilis]|uniref:Uncharacterized protein n=1 Tax=Brachionus plicatilis TaxID=10195 RepID=A0A3M7PYE0_BRAPC|nr:hypothetical protein BpHYR1_048081 [Brachionus plicatilis]
MQRIKTKTTIELNSDKNRILSLYRIFFVLFTSSRNLSLEKVTNLWFSPSPAFFFKSQVGNCEELYAKIAKKFRYMANLLKLGNPRIVSCKRLNGLLSSELALHFLVIIP